MSYDRRDYMAYRGARTEDVVTITTWDEDDCEVVIALPSKFSVCGTCNGKGAHVNPSIDCNGITESEMYELGEDFREDYFSGMYNQQCNECAGKRVVAVVDEDILTKEQQGYYTQYLEEQQERYNDYVTQQRECGYW